MADSAKLPIVLDNGTGLLKIGYAGANFPSAVFPTVIGRPVLRAGATKVKGGTASTASAASSVTAGSKNASVSADVDELKDLMLGDETIRFRHLLEMSLPVSNGIVQNVDEMCLLWNYAFSNKLKVDPKDHRLSLSEAPIASDDARGRLFEVFFETYGVPAIQSTNQGVLTLYSSGETTGLAVDSGDGVTHCTPIYDGYSLKKANRRVDIGGRDVTKNLVKLMMRRGYNFHSSSDFELVRAVKEKFGYVAVDYKAELKLARTTTYCDKTMTLPDNSVISIGSERFEAAECLFNPALIGVECEGLSTQVWESINAADMDVRAALYQNVILAGGSTMFPGLPSRIEADMREMFVEKGLQGDRKQLHRFKLRIHDPPRRRYMAFLGGTCYAQLTLDSPDLWMTKAQWDEGGSNLAASMFSNGY